MPLSASVQGFVDEAIHGVVVRDPCRWLEEGCSSETRAWVADQQHRYDEYLAQSDDLDLIRERVREYLDVETVDQPARIANQYFFRRRDKGSEQASIYVRDISTEEERLLVDPSTRGTLTSVEIHRISFDGSLLAYELRQGGADTVAIHVVDVESGVEFSDKVESGYARGFTFATDCTGFYYCQESVEAFEDHTIHASRIHVDEVNFWRPSPNATFKALDPGELFLFKLHSPQNYLVGGGFFTKFQQLPVNMAWDAFREANGVTSLAEMRQRIGYYRRSTIGPAENPTIGCIMLAEPFFWPEDLWIASPADFKPQTVQGKGYDGDSGTGRDLWNEVEKRFKLYSPAQLKEETATLAALESHGSGKPQIVLPRLGQGSFRIVVTDAYERRCALTGERTLPVLDAAHIKPYSVLQRHEVSNGMLMRSDLHRLFDEGYRQEQAHSSRRGARGRGAVLCLYRDRRKVPKETDHCETEWLAGRSVGADAA
jgi:putative restriction endonuclease